MTYVIVLCKLHSRMAPDIRGLVEKALENRGLDLIAFITTRREDGKSVKEITEDLNLVTGIPVTWRTVYRWLESERKERTA